MKNKTNAGRFFEDYQIGQLLVHAAPRTLGDGERALYTALYPTRAALYSSDAFARNCGLARAPIDPLIVFHTVFGKTVPDISLNAVANLGYAQGRFLKPVFAGTTLRAQSVVIGLKENSNGETGIVYVRTTGFDDEDEAVLEYVRWVMVRKRDTSLPAPAPVIPSLARSVSADELIIPDALSFVDYDFSLAGEVYGFDDYQIGEVIDHIDGVTIEEAEHMMATRLWHNTAKVHFDALARPDGRRLIYGGHIISLAQALSFNGLANANPIIAINAGTHVNPAFAGDRISAYSEIIDKAAIRDDVGALRIRLIARKGALDPTSPAATNCRGDDGKYLDNILLDFDYWALIPR